MSTTKMLGWAGLALVSLAIVAGLWLELSNPKSGTRQAWDRYVHKLDHEMRFLFLDLTGARIAQYQLTTILLLLLVAAFLEQWTLLMTVPVIAVAPWAILASRHKQRVEEIEKQLDSTLLLLANALKATPSLGEAMSATAKIVRPPIRQELDLCLKEIQLGTALDQALINTSHRIGSRTVSSAFATILVGRQTGGDLPRILEESAATLREMARLDGVVRTKTAEGKAQAYVLAAIPFVLIGAIHYIDPNWLEPLTNSPIGYAILVVATILWVAAIWLARKILAVDV